MKKYQIHEDYAAEEFAEIFIDPYKKKESEFCENLIYESHCFEKEAHKSEIDLQEIIDNLQRLLRDALRLREINKD